MTKSVMPSIFIDIRNGLEMIGRVGAQSWRYVVLTSCPIVISCCITRSWNTLWEGNKVTLHLRFLVNLLTERILVEKPSTCNTDDRETLSDPNSPFSWNRGWESIINSTFFFLGIRNSNFKIARTQFIRGKNGRATWHMIRSCKINNLRGHKWDQWRVSECRGMYT